MYQFAIQTQVDTLLRQIERTGAFGIIEFELADRVPQMDKRTISLYKKAKARHVLVLAPEQQPLSKKQLQNLSDKWAKQCPYLPNWNLTFQTPVSHIGSYAQVVHSHMSIQARPDKWGPLCAQEFSAMTHHFKDAFQSAGITLVGRFDRSLSVYQGSGSSVFQTISPLLVELSVISESKALHKHIAQHIKPELAALTNAESKTTSPAKLRL